MLADGEATGELEGGASGFYLADEGGRVADAEKVLGGGEGNGAWIKGKVVDVDPRVGGERGLLRKMGG